MGSKKEPLPGNSLATRDSRKGPKIEDLSNSIKRYSQAKARAEQNKNYISEIIDSKPPKLKSHYIKQYEKLEDCGSYLLFRNYYTIDQVKLCKSNFCKIHLLCPLCAIRRGARSMAIYLKKFQHLKELHPDLKVSLLTLTVKNGDDLGDTFEHLKSGWKKIGQRIRDAKRKKSTVSEFAKIKGWVGSYEVTNKGKGWHPHSHAIVLHEEEIDQEKLSKDWHKITGDSFILDIQRCDSDPVKDFCEVFKYAMKFSDLSMDHLFEAYEYFRGKRLVFSGGLFWGVKIPEDLNDDLPDEDLPYIEMLYRYCGKKGYLLVKYDGNRVSPVVSPEDAGAAEWERMKGDSRGEISSGFS